MPLVLDSGIYSLKLTEDVAPPTINGSWRLCKSLNKYMAVLLVTTYQVYNHPSTMRFLAPAIIISLSLGSQSAVLRYVNPVVYLTI
jgi:hypothetical protein